MKRRIFCWILALALCFTLLPASAAADEASEEETFTVTFDLGGHGTGPVPAPQTVRNGGRVSAPEDPAPGLEDGFYYFVHWTADPYSDATEAAWNFDSGTVKGDMTLRAVWFRYTEVHENVSRNDKPYDSAAVEYRDGSGKTAYTFHATGTDGKYTDYVCDGVKPGNYNFFVDGRNLRPVTVNPGSINSYTPTSLFLVSFSANGQEFTPETRPADVLCYTSGPFRKTSVSMPETTPRAVNGEYVFAGWTVGPAADSGPFDFAKTITGETVVYAQWETVADEDSFLVTAVRSSIVGSKYARKGQDYSATLVPDAGYKLPYHAPNGSYTSYTYVKIGDAVLDAGNYSFDCSTGALTIPGQYVTGNIQIKTIPQILPYTVTFDANGGSGTQTPLEIYPFNDGYDYEKDYGSRYASFTPPECTFTPPNGKVFSGWSGAEEFLNYNYLRVTGSTTLTAQWADAPAGVYTVAYTLTGCTFTGKTNTEAGKDYVTRLVPSGEYTYPIPLSGITAGGAALESGSYTYNAATGALTISAAAITGNLSITAKATVGYPVTCRTSGGGSVSAAPALAAKGETVKLAAVPDAGYLFKEWRVVSPVSLRLQQDGSFIMPGEAVVVEAVFESAVYTGTCGRDLTWTLVARTGVLTIAGTGSMDSRPSWSPYMSLIRSVEFPAGLTSVSDWSFNKCENLQSISLPDSVTVIREDSFRYCRGAASVTLHAGITDIGARAFLGCGSLKGVYFYGTQDEWDAIRIASDNDPLLHATLHLLTPPSPSPSESPSPSPSDDPTPTPTAKPTTKPTPTQKPSGGTGGGTTARPTATPTPTATPSPTPTASAKPSATAASTPNPADGEAAASPDSAGNDPSAAPDAADTAGAEQPDGAEAPTGAKTPPALPAILGISAAAAALILILWFRRRRKEE